MEDKDDFDVFIEDAEEVVRMYEAGHNVEREVIQLQKRALLVNPSTIPSTSTEPILVSKIVAECTNLRKSQIDNVRQRYRIPKSYNNNMALHDQPVRKTNLTFMQRTLIFIILFTSSCFIYYLRMPVPCPHPVW